MDIETRDLLISEGNDDVWHDEKFKSVVHSPNDEGFDALFVAVKYSKNPEAFFTNYIQHFTFRPNSRDREGNTLLHVAKNAKVVLSLLRHGFGFYVEAINHHGHSPLHHSLIFDELEKAKVLMDYGAKLNYFIIKDLIKSRNEMGSDYVETVFQLIENYL